MPISNARQTLPSLRRRCAGARLGAFALTLACAVATSSVRAQSIRDAVRDHVRGGLEGDDASSEASGDEKSGEPQVGAKTKKKKVAKKRARPPRKSPPRATSGSPGGSLTEETAEETPPGERLPKRLFGRDFQIDLKLGTGFRGWYPEQYPLVSIDHTGYFTWSADVKAKLFGFIRLHRGYYESSGLSGPRTLGAVVARQVGKLAPKAAWLLGTLGVPLSKRWETLVSYETRSFRTRANPTEPVAIVARDTPSNADFGTLRRSQGALEMVSGFETLVLGVRYFPVGGSAGLLGERGGGVPPMYFGVGFTQYSKPYQVLVGSDALDELLFDGRFRGVGLAYGLSMRRAIDKPYVELDSQLGLGEVRLLDDLTLNELLPEDWLIGYLQGDVTLGYILPLLRTRPTLLLNAELTAGGATFFYFQVNDGGGQGGSGEPSGPPTLPLNWDFLWSARVSLTLPM